MIPWSNLIMALKILDRITVFQHLRWVNKSLLLPHLRLRLTCVGCTIVFLKKQTLLQTNTRCVTARAATAAFFTKRIVDSFLYHSLRLSLMSLSKEILQILKFLWPTKITQIGEFTLFSSTPSNKAKSSKGSKLSLVKTRQSFLKFQKKT
jgi:hypothetical protein